MRRYISVFFFVCIGSSVLLSADYDTNPTIRLPIPTIPAKRSFLYDGSSIELIATKGKKTKKGQVKLSYSPPEAHTQLASIEDADKNVGVFSLTLFTRHKDGKRECHTHNPKKIFTQKFDEQKGSYIHALGRLYEHNAHHRANEHNVVKTMLDGRKTHVANQLHHSEQWILNHIHDTIKDYIFHILRVHPEIEKVYGVCLNIYSTNDVCVFCGPTIEEVLPLLQAEVVGFLSFGQVKIPKSFNLFASVSSSFRYDKAYLSRPLHPNPKFEEMLDYRDFYQKADDVRKGPIPLKGLKQKVLYFWTPRPEYKEYKKERSFDEEVEECTTALNFIELMDEFDDESDKITMKAKEILTEKSDHIRFYKKLLEDKTEQEADAYFNHLLDNLEIEEEDDEEIDERVSIDRKNDDLLEYIEELVNYGFESDFKWINNLVDSIDLVGSDDSPFEEEDFNDIRDTLRDIGLQSQAERIIFNHLD